MTGEELARTIEGNDFLKIADVKYTIMHLLREGLINPSLIIDAYTDILNEDYNRIRAHFEDSCVTTHQLLNGNFRGEDLKAVKRRASYNTKFSRNLNGIEPVPLTEKEREKCRENFIITWGFDPEKE